MPHVALLRGVNVGPHKAVGMAELRAMFAALGFADARTLLRSGNVVFDGGRRTPAALERLLGDAARDQLALDTTFFVRTAAEWGEVVAANPYAAEAERDPAHLVVALLADAPPAAALDALRGAIRGRETVELRGRTLYAVYPDGIGDSRLTAAVIDRALKTRCTARNWNTVLKVREAFAY